MGDFDRLEQLITGGHCCISIVTYEEQYALEVVRQAAMNLKCDVWVWTFSEGVRNWIALQAEGPIVADTDKPDTGLCNLAGSKDGSICVTLDLAAHLNSGKTSRILRDMIDRFSKKNSTLIMIDSEDKLPSVIKSYSAPLEISFPDEKELQDIINTTLKRLHHKKPIEIGITRAGLDAVVRNLRGLSRRQAQQIIIDATSNDQRFDDNDINEVIAGKRRMIQSGGLLEYIQTPLDLSEIGGMKRLKRWLKLRKDAFGAKAVEFGLKAPRGVLMLGVQGAGKSLCAKAIATAWQLPLLRMDPGALYACYIGESERNLRDALRQTEMMSPVVLWIDEIEKAFASAASRSVDGGLSQRMFGTLLTWLQEHEAPVFVVATANDIEALPPELLRKGRFDEIFFVELPDHAVRMEIFTIHLKKRRRDPKHFDLDKLADASQNYSGSEIEQAILSALHEAYANKTELDTNGILSALQNSPPLSVTMAEKVRQLLAWAKGRCVSAD
ncbi:MAG: AAA family ATPase [Planctomycetota bacterium]|nr:AAA family ATPase [Planctomycetota bacterium]